MRRIIFVEEHTHYTLDCNSLLNEHPFKFHTLEERGTIQYESMGNGFKYHVTNN